MVERDDSDWPVGRSRLESFAVNATNRLKFEIEVKMRHDIAHAVTAEGGDDFRFDDVNLPVEKRRIQLDLLWRGVAILGWAILDNVGDVDIGTLETDAFDEVSQELPCRSAERLAGHGLSLAGCFADEHNTRIVTAFARYREIVVRRAVFIERRRAEDEKLIANLFHVVVFLI